MGDVVFHPFDVLVKLGKVPVGGVRVLGEEFSQVALRLAFFCEEGKYLIDHIGHHISVLVFPLNPEVQSYKVLVFYGLAL